MRKQARKTIGIVVMLFGFALLLGHHVGLVLDVTRTPSTPIYMGAFTVISLGFVIQRRADLELRVGPSR